MLISLTSIAMLAMFALLLSASAASTGGKKEGSG
jgi:hypothetical protein